MLGQLILQALIEGSVYALVALGLTTIYNATKVINFAQGEFLIFGSAVAYVCGTMLNWSPILIAITAIVAGVVLSLLVERLIMIPVARSRSHFAWIVVTLAIALVFQAIFNLNFNQVTFHPAPMIPGSVSVFGTAVSLQAILLIVTTAIVGLTYGLVLTRTTFGRAVRATGFDSDTAQLMAISVRSVVIFSFIIGGVMTVVAGLLVAPLYFISPASGLIFTTGGFIAMVIGGLGSAKGSIIGGLIVGFLYSAVANLFDAQYSQMIVIALLVIILIVRPQGLFALGARRA